MAGFVTSKYGHHRVDLREDGTSWSKITALVPEGAGVLDVGCSSGYLGEALMRERNASVAGIELNPDDAAAARGRGLDPVLEGDLDAFDWSLLGDRRFDVIVFADVLEHLRAPQTVLRQAAGFLAEDGRVVISVPNIAHLSIRVELMEGSFIYEPLGILDDTHTKYFTRPTLLAMVAGAGLHVRRVDATLYDLPADLIKSRLAAVGLESRPAFDRLIQSDEARAYQWVVVAGRGPGPVEEVPLPEKLVMPHAQLVAERAFLEMERDALRAEAEHARNDAEIIKRTWAYRIGSIIVRPYRALRGR